MSVVNWLMKSSWRILRGEAFSIFWRKAKIRGRWSVTYSNFILQPYIGNGIKLDILLLAPDYMLNTSAEFPLTFWSRMPVAVTHHRFVDGWLLQQQCRTRLRRLLIRLRQRDGPKVLHLPARSCIGGKLFRLSGSILLMFDNFFCSRWLIFEAPSGKKSHVEKIFCKNLP